MQIIIYKNKILRVDMCFYIITVRTTYNLVPTKKKFKLKDSYTCNFIGQFSSGLKFIKFNCWD